MNDARVPLEFLSRVRRRLGGLRDEAGFTLVEITAATGVVLTALVMMAGVMTSGLTGTAIARERQTANGIANQTLEKVRALPFETLRRGLDTADLAATAGTTDPNITGTGCDGTYCFRGERIVSGTNAGVDPLVPHRRSLTADDATDKTFVASVYVTYYSNDLASNAFRVTTVVDWTSRVRSGSAQSVEAQTVIFPNGCGSVADHPYSGPCQATFTASALGDPSTISVDGTVGGIEIARAIIAGGQVSSDQMIEQTARVEGLVRGAGATLQAVGGDERSVGHTTVTSQADNDPSATKGAYESQDLGTQAAATTDLTSPTGSLTASVGAGAGGRTTSTTSASIAAGRPCPNLGGTDQTDGLPCGASASATGGAATVSSALNVGALSASAFPLAAIGPQAAPNAVRTDRTTSAGVDTAMATASRSGMSFNLGGLPTIAGLIPAGFDYYVRVSGYSDDATAVAGPGSTAPTASTTGGQLHFYTGALLQPYTTVNLSTVTSANVPSIPPLNLTLPLLATQVSMTAVVTPETKTPTSSCSGTCTRTSASYDVKPINITVTVRIVVAGETALDVSMNLDPGMMRTKASYVAAATS